MDWLTFISKLVESLAWPTVALILGLVVRKKILDLIPAIRKLKAGPVEAEFELATKQVLANTVEAVGHDASEAEAEKSVAASSKGEIVSKLLSARNDPSGIILEGWAKVDGELFRLGQQTGMFVDPLMNTTKVYASIMSSEVLPVEIKPLIRELRELRNKVAHVQVVPTSDSAQDYLLATDRVVGLLKSYRKKLPDYKK